MANPLSEVQFSHGHYRSTAGLPYKSPETKAKTKTLVLTDKKRGQKPNVYVGGTATGKIMPGKDEKKKHSKNGSSGHHSGATLQVHDMPKLVPGHGKEKGAPSLTASYEKAKALGHI